MRELLVLFGWCSILTSAIVIIVPYLRGRQPLISWWTLYHIGCMNFMGMASIQSGGALGHVYSSPRESDYLSFIIAGVAFYIVSIVTYYWVKFPRRMGERMFTKWGPRTVPALLTAATVGTIAVLGYAYAPNIQLLGQLLVQFGRLGGVYALAFCLIAWSLRPLNLWLLVFAVIAFAIAAVAGNLEFGRRDFLAVLLTPAIIWYWLRGRNSNPFRTFVMLGGFAAVAGICLAGISLVRSARTTSGGGIFENAYAKIRSIPAALSSGAQVDSVVGGDTVEASLATIQLYDHQPTRPFFTFYYVLANPIPRAWWAEEDKPAGLGYTLPFDIGWYRVHGAINLGPGIIGHGYQEGGLIMVIFYAIFYSACLRFFDSMVQRDPNNPYVLAMFCGASGQVVAFVRGDCALFMVLIIGGLITGVILNWIARLLYGTERYLPEQPMQAFDPAMPQYTFDAPSTEWNQF